MPKVPLIAALILALAVSSAQDSAEKRLKSHLQDLLELARRIDSGQTTLVQARKSEGQPDKAMVGIRASLHDNPSVASPFLTYIRSDETPLPARMIAIFSLVQPTRQELIVLLGNVLEESANENLAQAVFFSIQIARRQEQGDEDWKSDFLGALGSLGCGRGYAVGGQMSLPFLRAQDDFSFANAPKGLSYHALLGSILTFLEKDKYPALRYRLQMAERIIEELHVRGGQQIRFESLVEKFYLEGKEGWQAALDALTRCRPFIFPPDPIELLGKGLIGFTPGQRTYVIGEVMRRCPYDYPRPPFLDYLDEAVELIGTEPKKGEEQARLTSNDSTILHVLIRQSLNDAWAERLLIKSESVRLRRLSSELVLRSCEIVDRFEMNRYSKFLERMTKDPDGIVVGNARAALRKALNRKPPVFDEARAKEIRKLLGIENK